MPMVVEEILEEQVSNIKDFIKGLYTRIEDLESRNTRGMPPEENSQRERTIMTIIENIKKLDEECTNLCEERTHIWKNLMEDSEMKSVEARLRDM
jgi:predicted  nucleic acid-binding Zn-ribbon protein